MTGLPPELEEWMPNDVPASDVAVCARVARSFDRVHGEALVVRSHSGEVLVLTRPEHFELFRALPLAAHDPVKIVEGREVRLHARTIDGRLLTLPLLPSEVEAVRAIGVKVTRTASAPPTTRPISDRPPRSATLRPPESADSEVVRVPRGVRAASELPRVEKPASDKPVEKRAPSTPPRAPSSPPPASGSVRPPGFASEPAPIVRSARDVGALRARFQHHWRQGELDEATEVARALVHLGIADGMERRLAEQQPEVVPSFASPLTPYLFRAYLAHDEEHPDLGRLLASIWPAYLQMRIRPERELGLRPRDEVDLATTDHPFAKLFGHAARQLGIATPRLFLRTDVAGGMAHLHTIPVASLCGGTLANGFDAPATLHVIGSHLSFYRPEAYLFALVPTPSDVHALVLAALWLEGAAHGVDARIGSLAETLARHMLPPVRDAMRSAVADLALDQAALGDALRRLRRAVMLSSVRAGFVLSGSLATSDRMQRIMPAVHGLTIDEMLDDLVTYSVSPSWMSLRKELGIALEPSTPHTRP